jgi:DNA-binding response OmpR family regulator
MISAPHSGCVDGQALHAIVCETMYSAVTVSRRFRRHAPRRGVRRATVRGGNDVRVLVIEDDQELAETVAVGLRRARMAVDVAVDGPQGLVYALDNDYDVIVLDPDLPGLHGDDICAEVGRAARRSRLLMLTAAATTDDLVEGLGLGADDYLAKPFDFPVLVARICALARRAQPAMPPVLRCGDLVVDTARRRVCRSDRLLDLTPKEFGVLEVLLASRGRVVSAEELLERAWDDGADPFTNAVKITMSRLRTKLGSPSIIETVARSGYRIVMQDAG